MMYRIDPHFLTILKAADVACDLIDLLPETDLRDEVRTVLNVQLEIIVNMLESKHYGTTNLNNFCDYIAQLKEEASRLKDEIGWRSE